jgi:hypothetical protein
MRYKALDLIYLVHDMDKWRAVASAVRNLAACIKRGKSLYS